MKATFLPEPHSIQEKLWIRAKEREREREKTDPDRERGCRK